ncbi:MAG: RNA polymerase sigma factor [Candidatus Aminicenantales bacterium]
MRTDTLVWPDFCFLKTVHAILNNSVADIPREEGQNGLADALMARQVLAGRDEFIGALVRKHSDRLYLILLRMVQSPNAAEDLLQDTWVLVMRKFHQYDPSRPILPWLTQIAVNCCRSYWRRERLRSLFRLAEISEKTKGREPESVVNTPREMEARVIAERALGDLSPRLREIVVLRFYSGLTNEDISEILRIPLGTVKSRLNYALARMRDSIEKGEKP